MYKLVTRRSASLLWLIIGLTASALAGQDDFSQPISVDADDQFIDGKNKTSTFTGNVEIAQGSLRINADQLEVIAGEVEGNDVFIARGNPVTYSQTMDDGSLTQASALYMRYEAGPRILTLEGQADVVHQNVRTSNAQSIVFNMELEQIRAEGTNAESGRVTTVFQPEAKPAEEQDSKEPPAGKDKQP